MREVPPPFTTMLEPGLLPKLTAVAPVRFEPVTVTEVPPVVGPTLGFTAVTIGPAEYVNWSAPLVAVVPAAVTTVTSTTPAMWAGALTVRDVPPPFTTTPVPGVAPKLTAVSPVRCVPVTVTEVPPARGPAVGLTEVTVGEGGGTRRIPAVTLTPAGACEDVGATTPAPALGLSAT